MALSRHVLQRARDALTPVRRFEGPPVTLEENPVWCLALVFHTSVKAAGLARLPVQSLCPRPLWLPLSRLLPIVCCPVTVPTLHCVKNRPVAVAWGIMGVVVGVEWLCWFLGLQGSSLLLFFCFCIYFLWKYQRVLKRDPFILFNACN